MTDGTALCPTVSAAADDYPELYRLGTRVGEGREAAEAFLLAAAANQLRGLRAGPYGAGFAAGGRLYFAEVTEAGAR